MAAEVVRADGAGASARPPKVASLPTGTDGSVAGDDVEPNGCNELADVLARADDEGGGLAATEGVDDGMRPADMVRLERVDGAALPAGGSAGAASDDVGSLPVLDEVDSRLRDLSERVAGDVDGDVALSGGDAGVRPAGGAGSATVEPDGELTAEPDGEVSADELPDGALSAPDGGGVGGSGSGSAGMGGRLAKPPAKVAARWRRAAGTGRRPTNGPGGAMASSVRVPVGSGAALLGTGAGW